LFYINISIFQSKHTPKATETNNAAKDSNPFPVFKDAKQAKKGGKGQNLDNETPGNNGVEQQLTQINEKLSNMLTKTDTGFLKQIIKDTICELLKPLIHQIEILEFSFKVGNRTRPQWRPFNVNADEFKMKQTNALSQNVTK